MTANEIMKSIKDNLDSVEHNLEQIQCDDCISRQAVLDVLTRNRVHFVDMVKITSELKELPSVTPKIGHCKDCKYFEYDSVARLDGIPLIVAHEICSRWGDGCKTKEDGYCFLFEPQESEE